MSTNRERFELELATQYRELFKLPAYAVAASRTTPEQLAANMTAGLAKNAAEKSGAGVKNTCKLLAVKHTYSAIAEYLAS